MLRSKGGSLSSETTEKEGNVLFNDALNTFYLRLYGVGHMVEDHSDSERGNLLPPHGLLFPISSKGSFICTIPHTLLCGALAGTRNKELPLVSMKEANMDLVSYILHTVPKTKHYLMTHLTHFHLS